MRCTKCSFISFDDLLACAKCATDLSRLSKDLNGTCIETRQEFFLGSAIQSSGLEEENFSDSQMLPPIDHADMNFDDTSTGGFSPLAPSQAPTGGLNFDDSMGVASEDDVAIELGDIMPIDFDQLDSVSASTAGAMESTDALPLDGLSFELDKSGGVPAPAESDIDLDLTADMVDAKLDFNFNDDLSDVDIDDSSRGIQSSLGDVHQDSFDATLDDITDAFPADAELKLDQELVDQLADVSGGFDETVSLGDGAGFDDTKIEPFEVNDSGSLELDESLVAELAGGSSFDGSGEFPIDFSSTDSSASGDFELDPALVAELAGDEGVGVGVGDEGAPATGRFSADDTSVLTEDSWEDISRVSDVDGGGASTPFEDLTGEFPPIQEEDDSVLSGLDLADIDVSDLVDSSADDVVGPSADDGNSLESQQDAFGESSFAESDSLAGDVSREEDVGVAASSPVDLSVDDGLVLEFDDDSLGGEEVAAADSLGGVSDAFGGEDVLAGLSPDNLPGLVLDDDLALGGADGDTGDTGEVSAPDDIDVLALDADFEAFLSKTASVEKLPEIELVPDDDDEDLPPDLPS